MDDLGATYGSTFDGMCSIGDPWNKILDVSKHWRAGQHWLGWGWKLTHVLVYRKVQTPIRPASPLATVKVVSRTLPGMVGPSKSGLGLC